jgi:outer membrane protein assembly factor BamB
MRVSIVLLSLLTLSGCHFFSKKEPKESWSKTLPGIGTFSSPRMYDVNGDGVQDIILGAGKAEFQFSDSAMIALDGKNGDLIWANSAQDQIFGSAALHDINGDGVKDVFLTGRSVEFKALDGKTGKEIWHFDTPFYSQNKKRWFNFYNPQFIQDIDGDGLPDIINSNGGDIKVPPFNPNRAAGRLVIMSSATGKLLAEAMMPDDKEIYMSIAINFNKKNPENSKIIFGTGGETVGGNLFVGTLKMVLDGDLSGAKKLAHDDKKGFIAPPAWVDINQDGQLDIVCNSVDGRILAFDGQSFAPLWATTLPKTEAYSSMAIGRFNDDQIPDFFVSFAKGRWPNLDYTKQAMISGKDGKIQFLDSLGYYQTSSPIVADMNGDQIDEVLLSVDYKVVEGREKIFNTGIFSIDFTTNEVNKLVEGIIGHNLSSTPWIGDMDHDGFLELIYCNGIDTHDSMAFNGLQVHCLKTYVLADEPVKWGSYMGSNYDGVFTR